jgi:GT2 family glycosyltransferase
MIRVSAIVSTYCASRFFVECIYDLIYQSLYEQGELEIIIIDSSSPENEEQLFKQHFSGKENIHYLRTPERISLYEAWNIGIRQSKGVYITNSNTDDRHNKDCLNILKNALDENQDIALVYGTTYSSYIPNETFEECIKEKALIPQNFSAPSLLHHYYYGAQPMWRKKVHESIGDFSNKYTALGDYEFAIRLAKNGYKSLYIPSAQGIMLWHDDAISNKNFTPKEEHQRLLSDFCSKTHLVEFYKSSMDNSLDPDKSHDHLQCILDYTTRSIAYYPQYKCGYPEMNLQSALKLTQEIDSKYSDIRENNLAVIYALGGDLLQCKNTLQSVEVVEDPVIKNNLEQLLIYEEDDSSPLLLQFHTSTFDFPLESSLCNATPKTYLKRGIDKTIAEINVTDCWSLTAGTIPDTLLQNEYDTYIWGANSNAQIISNRMKKKQINLRGIIDGNKVKQGQIQAGVKVISPSEILDKKNPINIILALGPNNWNTVKKISKQSTGLIHFIEPIFNYRDEHRLLSATE